MLFNHNVVRFVPYKTFVKVQMIMLFIISLFPLAVTYITSNFHWKCLILSVCRPTEQCDSCTEGNSETRVSTVFIDMAEAMDCLRKVTIGMFKVNCGWWRKKLFNRIRQHL